MNVRNQTLNLIGLCAIVLSVCLGAAAANAALLGSYAFDGDAGTSNPATVAELGGNTALDLALGSVASYNADTPFAYAGNTSLDVSGGAQARASNDTTTAYQFVNNAAWSISAWVKTSASGAIQTIIGHRKSSTGNGYILGVTSAGVAFVQVQGQSAPDGRFASGGAAINNGVWHHVVLVNDPNTDADGSILLYVDGSLAASDIKVQPNAIDYGNSTFAVGVQRDLSAGNVNPLTGLVDEVALYSHALTTGEITTLFNNSLVPEPASVGMVLLGMAAMFRRR